MLVIGHIGHWAVAVLEFAPVVTVVVVIVVWKLRNRDPGAGES